MAHSGCKDIATGLTSCNEVGFTQLVAVDEMGCHERNAQSQTARPLGDIKDVSQIDTRA